MLGVTLSKKEITLYGLFAVVIGVMTGLGFGHYKNIRFEIMRADLQSLTKANNDLSSMLKSLNLTLNIDVSKSMSQIVERNSMESSCTKKLNHPNGLTSNFKKTPQILLSNNLLAYKYDPNNPNTAHSLALHEMDVLIHDRDLILKPPANFNLTAWQNQFELCWIALTDNKVK